MSSMKGKLARLLGSAVLTSARVVTVDVVGQSFRKLRLSSDAPTPQAGTKIQLLLPSDDMRTYSPIAAEGGMVLLASTQAGGPGARWMAQVQSGDELRFFRPQPSLALRAGPVIIVGDETSLAVAAAFEAERSGQVHAVFAANSVDDVQAAVAAVGLRNAAVMPREKIDDIIEAVFAAQSATPEAIVALTGGSELIVALRTQLRARGVQNIKTKSYWVPGRCGLD